MKILPGKRGVALPTSLWMLLALTTLGTIFLIIMSIGYYSSAKSSHEFGAYYCAYSGIIYAQAMLQDNPGYLPSSSGDTVNLDTGTALITATTDASGNLLVTSVGRYGQHGKVTATETIQATFSSSNILEWHDQG